MLNSVVFHVIAGSTFAWTMEARVSPQSVGSGYWAISFLSSTNEVGRKKIPLEPAVFSAGDARVDATGDLHFTVSGLPAGAFQMEARYPGDDRHLPGQTTLRLER